MASREAKATLRNRLLEWARALESGKYRQATEVLREPAKHGGHTKMCCLGVACEVYHRATGKGEWRRDEGGAYEFVTDAGAYEALLPVDVAQWYGVEIDPQFENEDEDYTPVFATNANDEERWKFRKIAKAVRRLADSI